MSTDLRRLRYFITVAEEGHITRAAERLGMQQPPLSRQISLMERELNVQLFRRLARGVEITAAGKALLREANALLLHFDRALEMARRAGRGEQGHLCLGIAPTAPFNPLVPNAIQAYRDKFPLVSLVMEEGLSNEIATRFSNDQMDVAFVRAPQVHAENVVVTSWQEEPMVAALPSRHPMANGRASKPVLLKSLASDSFILIGPPGTALHDETVAACHASGFAPRFGQAAPRITSTLGLVAAGMGIALVPSTMQSVRMAGVIYRRLQGTVPRAFLGLASRRDDPSPVLKQFVRLVLAFANRQQSADRRSG